MCQRLVYNPIFHSNLLFLLEIAYLDVPAVRVRIVRLPVDNNLLIIRKLLPQPLPFLLIRSGMLLVQILIAQASRFTLSSLAQQNSLAVPNVSCIQLVIEDNSAEAAGPGQPDAQIVHIKSAEGDLLELILLKIGEKRPKN